jgi:hypothetical protein
LDTPVDLLRYFIPEHFTPLFYTPLYAQLTEQQRLRYNQLHGCYTNEQIMFFEQTMAPNLLAALLRRPIAASLASNLRDFMAEEQRHTLMFRELNRRCFPHLYATHDFYFVQAPWGAANMLAWASRRPWVFACLVWIMLLEEERAVMLGREMLRCRTAVEPHFVALHRLHLADEIGHVQWDEALLDDIWQPSAPGVRKANAVLLRWLMGEFFVVPKRSNMRVVVQLTREFPALRPLLPQCRQALLALKDCDAWNALLYSRASVPKAFARFDTWPEMHPMRRVLHGYMPRAPEESREHG